MSLLSLTRRNGSSLLSVKDFIILSRISSLRIDRYRTRALLLLPLFANAGMLLGPLVGGLLSSNAEEPSRSSKFPYLLPNLLVSAIYFVSAVGIAFRLKETLKGLEHVEESIFDRYWRRLRQALPGRKQHYAALGQDDCGTPTSPLMEISPTTPTAASSSASDPFLPPVPKKKRKLAFNRIWTFNVCCTMLTHFIISGHLGTFSNLWAIFLSTPIGSTKDQSLPLKFNGGLGMRPRDVGFAMSLLGAIGVVLQMAVYPTLQDRFGTLSVWRFALFIFPIAYLLAPFSSLVASRMQGEGVLVWLCMSFILLLYVLGRTGVTPATTLLINDCTPHPSVRGKIHTAATVVGNLARSIFPVAALTVFGQGIKIGVVGLGFWCITCLAILSCITSGWVKEGSNGREIVLSDDEEEVAPTNAAPQ